MVVSKRKFSTVRDAKLAAQIINEEYASLIAENIYLKCKVEALKRSCEVYQKEKLLGRK